MSLALLFPGQGVQHVDMLRWLDAEPAAAPVEAALAARLGGNWRARVADDAWASRNDVAQPLIVGLSLAAWHALAPHLPAPAIVAGYSVGELAACSAAGVFDAACALDLAQQRAAAMDRSAGREPAGLLAVAGVPAHEVETLCARTGLAVAIRIGVDRCVVGGPLAALDAAMPTLAARGAELTRLRVRVASHTPSMAAAAAAFDELIVPLAWQRSRCVVASNLDGAGRRDVASLKHALAAQIDHTVHWDRCMDTIAERQPRCVLEVGPGTSLARMWAARHPDVPVRSVDEFHSAQAVIAWVRRALS